MHQIAGDCPGKTSAHNFGARFHKVALLGRLERGHKVTFHVKDSYELVARHDGHGYLRFHQI